MTSDTTDTQRQIFRELLEELDVPADLAESVADRFPEEYLPANLEASAITALERFGEPEPHPYFAGVSVWSTQPRPRYVTWNYQDSSYHPIQPPPVEVFDPLATILSYCIVLGISALVFGAIYGIIRLLGVI